MFFASRDIHDGPWQCPLMKAIVKCLHSFAITVGVWVWNEAGIERACSSQATPDRKAKEVTCWLVQAYDELLEGWDSTEGESYSERYHVRGWPAVFTSRINIQTLEFFIIWVAPYFAHTGVASTQAIFPPLGVAHLSGVLQWAAAPHHAFADRNETKPETDRGAANTPRGLGRPHCQGAATFFLFISTGIN